MHAAVIHICMLCYSHMHAVLFIYACCAIHICMMCSIHIYMLCYSHMHDVLYSYIHAVLFTYTCCAIHICMLLLFTDPPLSSHFVYRPVGVKLLDKINLILSAYDDAD